MILYPAIDLIDGACVRLAEGRFDAVTHYDKDPLKRLEAFVADGAEWVHIVDLDGARQGQPVQHERIGALARATSARIQTGGGIRTRAHVETLLKAGVSAVVVGSAAVKSPDMMREWLTEFGADSLTLALDVRPVGGDFEVAVHGWAEGSGLSLWAVLDHYPEGVAKRVLVTDVSRDGLLQGPNFDLMTALRTRRPDLEIQASGGVSGPDDLIRLQALGCDGAIVGKAIYENRIALKPALEALTHAG